MLRFIQSELVFHVFVIQRPDYRSSDQEMERTHSAQCQSMGLLANNIYNLSLSLVTDDSEFETSLPTAVDFGSFTPERIDLLGDLITERFGRSCHEHLREVGGGIMQLASTLEKSPQVTVPKTVLNLKMPSRPDAGLVILFSGQHGLGRSFQKLSKCIPGDHFVIAFDYDGLDSNSAPVKSVDQSIDLFFNALLRDHPGILDEMASSGQEVVLFGLCLGSCFAHAFAHRISRDHDLNIRLVFFDGHPAEWFSKTSVRSLFRSSKKALEFARTRGDLERRLVRQGRRQHHMLSKHTSRKVNFPALLIRSNSVGASWDLTQESWQPYVRSCRHVDLLDISHIDLIQRRQESRISSLLEPGARLTV